MNLPLVKLMTKFINKTFLLNGDINTLKNERVERGPSIYSFGIRADLEKHFDMLAQEFSGRSFLELHHAELTTLIRRGVEREAALQRFWKIWDLEREFLVKNLDSRWLISTCDTIIDWSENSEERAFACAGTLFMNTIKLYETERLTALIKDTDQLESPRGRVALFDGLSTFKVGRGDMVRNMLSRIHKSAQNDSLAGRVVLELISRANINNTVYFRFRNRHENTNTGW